MFFVPLSTLFLISSIIRPQQSLNVFFIGIFISMLHLLADAPMEIIHADYLASEVDVKISRLNLVLDIITEKGGIEPYLLSCGLTVNQISKLKQKLLN